MDSRMAGEGLDHERIAWGGFSQDSRDGFPFGASPEGLERRIHVEEAETQNLKYPRRGWVIHIQD